MQKFVRRAASVLVAVGLAAGMTSLAAEPASAAAKSTATAKEYGKIEGGQTLAQVRKTVGGSGTRVLGEGVAAGEQVYVWRSTKGKNVYVGFKNGKVIGKSRENDATVSPAEYRKLKKGQSYRKVSKIIREKGKKAYSKRDGSTTYTGYVWWDDTETKTVAILFADGKLIEKNRITEE